jgi:deoxyribodipyrimidine photo-lyase
MTSLFPPTREAGLARLAAFTPHMGRAYANGRNTDPGPGLPTAVSMLSPYLRRRLITEAEAVGKAAAAHGELAEKFIHEVAWRSYFKGWLEQHPSVWTDYEALVVQGENRLATESGLRRVYHDACEGRTGIDGFDDWAQALVADNWLHNHTRMWFASIWIFTLRLPWALGAAFFLRHLLDGDPASNTLSWRWVAGLHTRGKHYVARADNIARYTNGRFNPQGQLDEAPECLTEQADHPRVRLAPADRLPPGNFSLLLHDEDLSPEACFRTAGEVAVVSNAQGADPVRHFTAAAMADMVARLGREVTRLEPAEIAAWVARQQGQVVSPWAPVGPTATALSGLDLLRVRRAWDDALWPHATKGFFQLKQRLPDLLPQLV